MDDIFANSTCLQGYITITHKEIVKKLGKGSGAFDKHLDEWLIERELNGEMIEADLYDWKNYGMKAKNITEWNIGGKNEKSVDLIRSIFPNHDVRLWRQELWES